MSEKKVKNTISSSQKTVKTLRFKRNIAKELNVEKISKVENALKHDVNINVIRNLTRISDDFLPSIGITDSR